MRDLVGSAWPNCLGGKACGKAHTCAGRGLGGKACGKFHTCAGGGAYPSRSGSQWCQHTWCSWSPAVASAQTCPLSTSGVSGATVAALLPSRAWCPREAIPGCITRLHAPGACWASRRRSWGPAGAPPPGPRRRRGQRRCGRTRSPGGGRGCRRRTGCRVLAGGKSPSIRACMQLCVTTHACTAICVTLRACMQLCGSQARVFCTSINLPHRVEVALLLLCVRCPAIQGCRVEGLARRGWLRPGSDWWWRRDPENANFLQRGDCTKHLHEKLGTIALDAN